VNEKPRLNNGIRLEVQQEAGRNFYLTFVKSFIIIVHNHTIKIMIIKFAIDSQILGQALMMNYFCFTITDLN